MGDTNSLVTQLRTRLEACRWQIKCGSDALSETLDIPQRVRREFSAHPWRWLAAGLVGGITLAWRLPARDQEPNSTPPPAPTPALLWQKATLGVLLSVAGSVAANALVRSIPSHPSLPAASSVKAAVS